MRRHIGIVSVDTGAEVLIEPAAPDSVIGAQWSPRGDSVSYLLGASNYAAPRSLWIADAGGLEQRVVADIDDYEAGSGSDVTGIWPERWSADGSHIWYSIHELQEHEFLDDWVNIHTELWAADTDTHDARMVAEGLSIHTYWSPNARHVAYFIVDGSSPYQHGQLWIARSDDP